MMRTWALIHVLFLVGLTYGCAPRRPVAIAIDGRLLVDHALNLDAFLRAYLGCTSAGVSAETCRPATGHVDAAAWSRARQSAAQLFDLKEAK